MFNITRLLQAIDYAAEQHSDQQRKGRPIPYINHPLHVTRLLAEIGGVTEEDVLVAAVLHDTVEDTGATPEDIERQFGAAVRSMVEEVTDDKSLPKAERKRLQIEHAPSLSRGAALIKLSDKCANVHDMIDTPPPDWPIDRIVDYIAWGEKVVARLPKVNAALEAHFADTAAKARQKWIRK